MKKSKYILFIFIAILLLLPLGKAVLALELSYPVLPGAPAITNDSPLPVYFKYFFVLAILTAGIMGVLSIVYAGVKILVSAGNPTAIGEARERIFNSILGIILLMFSIVILNTINPTFTKPSATYLGLQTGVYLRATVGVSDAYPGGYAYTAAPSYVYDSRTDLPFYGPNKPYDTLIYKCEPPGPTLLVWVYDGVALDRDSSSIGGDTISIKCGDATGIIVSPPLSPVLSFRQQLEDTGVYYYLEEGCSGLATCAPGTSCAQKESGDIPNFDFRPDLDQTVRSFRIVNNKDPLNRYAVVLAKQYSLDGECSPPFINTTDTSQCFSKFVDIDQNEFNPFSAFITKQAKTYPANNKVELYSDHLKWTLASTDIEGHYYISADLNGLIKTSGKQWTKNNPPPEECTNSDVDENGDIITCLNQINTLGDFNIFLYSIESAANSANKKVDRTCKKFLNGFNDTDPLNPDPLFSDLLSNNKQIYEMDIIPYPH